MASKNKHDSRQKSPADDIFVRVRRNLAKANFKDALKDAKLGYRQAPSPEHRQLLEQAFLGRVRELCRFGMRDEARAVLAGLLELGVTQPDVDQELPPLLITLGMFDKRPAAASEHSPPATNRPLDPELVAKLADHAVLHPNEASQRVPGLREQAGLVRSALQQLADESDDPQAVAATLESLRGIPFNSPLSDWKLFVRGLAAYYRRDDAEMTANWSRLAADRPAARIAATLRTLASHVSSSRADDATQLAIRKVERGVCPFAVLPVLYDVRRSISDNQWEQAIQRLRAVRETFRRHEPALWRRLCLFLYREAVNSGNERLLGLLRRGIDPPEFDPSWNNALAHVYTSPPHNSTGEALEHWNLYRQEVRRLEALSPAERPLAEALTLLRMARASASSVELIPSVFRKRGWGCSAYRRLRRTVIECYQEAIRLAPQLKEAYTELATFCKRNRRQRLAIGACRQLLIQFPDDVDALMKLATYEAENDQAEAALAYARRALHLRPLDRQIIRFCRAALSQMGLEYARSGQWELGRAALAQLADLRGRACDSLMTLAVQAAFEWMAGQDAQAQAVCERALAQYPHPAAVWLALLLEAQRFGLSSDRQQDLHARFLAALKGKFSSGTAGSLAEVLAPWVSGKCPWFSNKAAILEAFRRYCLRHGRKQWERKDLRSVCTAFYQCGFAAELPSLVRIGFKRFPDDAVIHVAAAFLASAGRPRRGQARKVRAWLDKALALARASTDPDDKDLVEFILQLLTLFDEATAEYGPLGWHFAQAARRFFNGDGEKEQDDEDQDDAGDTLDDDADEGDDGYPPDAVDADYDYEEDEEVNLLDLMAVLEQMCREFGLDPQDLAKFAQSEMGDSAQFSFPRRRPGKTDL
jgi:tetratricopeptide (TPR) repeat protein